MQAAAEAGRRRFWRVSAAGILFQGGAAAADTSTVVASLVSGLTGGDAFAVGAAAALARFGWLFPQPFVGYHAQRRARRLPFYAAGAFGRVACLAGLAGLLWLARAPPGEATVVLFFAVWTAYAFVSGLVAVPYNDIVGRSIPSDHRSRMLALRFFGGGLLALAVAAAAHRILAALPFPAGHAAVLLLGAALLLASAVSFVSAGEPKAPPPPRWASSASCARAPTPSAATDASACSWSRSGSAARQPWRCPSTCCWRKRRRRTWPSCSGRRWGRAAVQPALGLVGRPARQAEPAGGRGHPRP